MFSLADISTDEKALDDTLAMDVPLVIADDGTVLLTSRNSKEVLIDAGLAKRNTKGKGKERSREPSRSVQPSEPVQGSMPPAPVGVVRPPPPPPPVGVARPPPPARVARPPLPARVAQASPAPPALPPSWTVPAPRAPATSRNPVPQHTKASAVGTKAAVTCKVVQFTRDSSPTRRPSKRVRLDSPFENPAHAGCSDNKLSAVRNVKALPCLFPLASKAVPQQPIAGPSRLPETTLKRKRPALDSSKRDRQARVENDPETPPQKKFSFYKQTPGGSSFRFYGPSMKEVDPDEEDRDLSYTKYKTSDMGDWAQVPRGYAPMMDGEADDGDADSMEWQNNEADEGDADGTQWWNLK